MKCRYRNFGEALAKAPPQKCTTSLGALAMQTSQPATSFHVSPCFSRATPVSVACSDAPAATATRAPAFTGRPPKVPPPAPGRRRIIGTAAAAARRLARPCWPSMAAAQAAPPGKIHAPPPRPAAGGPSSAPRHWRPRASSPAGRQPPAAARPRGTSVAPEGRAAAKKAESMSWSRGGSKGQCRFPSLTSCLCQCQRACSWRRRRCCCCCRGHCGRGGVHGGRRCRRLEGLGVGGR
mmetsp:Transcript_9500/g.33652  ORF Transcript_9500/g.33652 Transcript_9500/m.33652 type:complete len:236 (+) Transcript_9500:710-1417(+)